MKCVVVNDAPCLIDLRKGGLLAVLCKLPYGVPCWVRSGQFGRGRGRRRQPWRRSLLGEVGAQGGGGWVVPQVVHLLGVGFEVVQFAVVEAVVGDQFVAVVAVHGGPAGGVAARLLGQVHVQGVVVFASHVVEVARRVGVAGQDRQQRAAVGPRERLAGQLGQRRRHVGQLHQAVVDQALPEAGRPGDD